MRGPNKSIKHSTFNSMNISTLLSIKNSIETYKDNFKDFLKFEF